MVNNSFARLFGGLNAFNSILTFDNLEESKTVISEVICSTMEKKKISFNCFVFVSSSSLHYLKMFFLFTIRDSKGWNEKKKNQRFPSRDHKFSQSDIIFLPKPKKSDRKHAFVIIKL